MSLSLMDGEGERAGAGVDEDSGGSSEERGEGVVLCCSVLLRDRVAVVAVALLAGTGCVTGFGAPWSFQRCKKCNNGIT